MKASEIRELTVEELEERVEELSLEYTKMKLTHAISPLENPTRIRETKKMVARLKTELRARELAQ